MKYAQNCICLSWAQYKQIKWTKSFSALRQKTRAGGKDDMLENGWKWWRWRQQQQKRQLVHEPNNSAFSTLLWRPLHDYNATFLYRNWTNDDEFSFFFMNLDKDLNHSIPGKIAYIWRTERLQINAITFKKTQITFSSSLLQFSNDHDDNGDGDEEDKDDDDDDDNELKMTITITIVYKNLSRLRKSIVFCLLYITRLNIA